MDKLVRDLKPGDILPANAIRTTVVVLGSYKARHEFFCVTLVNLLSVGGDVNPMPAPYTVAWYADNKVEVEHPTLTPAQQYADELLEYTKRYAATQGGEVGGEKLRALLNKINPPNPPTFDEVIEFLRRLKAGNSITGLAADLTALLERVPK